MYINPKNKQRFWREGGYDMSKIEWTDETWNPIAGCSKVSPGCANCYAEKMAGRLEAMGQAKYTGLTGSHRVWTGKIAFDEKALLAPLKRKGKPLYDAQTGERVGFGRGLRYFVNSMSDLFHENVTDEQIDRVFAVMALCPQHTFQVLTKRPERMKQYLSDDNPRYTIRRIFDAAEKIDQEKGYVFDCDIYHPLMNVWLGVSVENQKTADERIPLLLQTPAAVRFISAEPLLGAVDLLKTEYLKAIAKPGWQGEKRYPFEGMLPDEDRTKLLHLLDWVIVGGESGPGARPMHPDWARSLRDQCEAAGVAFFFKQWGEYTSEQVPGVEVVLDTLKPGQCMTNGIKGHHTLYTRVGKKAAGALLDGREWRQWPGEAR